MNNVDWWLRITTFATQVETSFDDGQFTATAKWDSLGNPSGDLCAGECTARADSIEAAMVAAVEGAGRAGAGLIGWRERGVSDGAEEARYVFEYAVPENIAGGDVDWMPSPSIFGDEEDWTAEAMRRQEYLRAREEEALPCPMECIDDYCAGFNEGARREAKKHLHLLPVLLAALTPQVTP